MTLQCLKINNHSLQMYTLSLTSFRIHDVLCAIKSTKKLLYEIDIDTFDGFSFTDSDGYKTLILKGKDLNGDFDFVEIECKTDCRYIFLSYGMLLSAEIRYYKHKIYPLRFERFPDYVCHTQVNYKMKEMD